MSRPSGPSTRPFFLLAFAWSWAFWIPAALWGPDAAPFITRLAFGLGGLGPMAAGLFFTWREQGWKGLSDYRLRLTDWRGLKFRGWVLTLLAVPVLTVLAGRLDRLLGGSGLRWDGTTLRFFTGFLPPVLSVPAFLGFLLLFGPVPEEMGWRGYALDRLRARWGPLGASLLLGLMWGMWHLPLFFLEGSYQSTLGVGTAGFYLFFAGVLAFSVVMTWVYDLAGRSLLSAILLHFSVNLTGTVAARGPRTELFRVLLCGVWALGIAFHWKRRDEAGRSNEPPGGPPVFPPGF